MSGYGAGMDIKKSDYLAIDDRQILAGGGEKGTVSKEDLLEKPKMVQLKKEQLARMCFSHLFFVVFLIRKPSFETSHN